MMALIWRGEQTMARIKEAVDAGLTQAAARVQAEAVRSLGREHGGIPSKPGSPPNSQSGTLRNSIKYASPQQMGTPGRAAVGTNVPYGRYLEFGASPRAKRGKFLTIPVHDKARRALVHAGSSRKIPNLIYIPRRGRAPLLVRMVGGRHKRMEIWFVLTPATNIAPRPWLRRAAITAGPAAKAAFAAAFRQRMGVA